LDGIDNEKSALFAQRDESTKQKSKKTTETGKTLMTIENLYVKCSTERPDMITSTKDYKDWEKVKNFDNTTHSGKKSVEQLKIVMQVIKTFKELMYRLENHENPHIKERLEAFRNGEETTK
jgi:hypothetical protein